MRIAIVGAMGVGKTTLAEDLSQELGFDVLPEVARLMAEEGEKLDFDITAEVERKIMERQCLLECTKGDIIADRCLLDVLAYSSVLFKKDKELIRDIKARIRKAAYDVVFYLAPEFPIENDGVRSTDAAFQARVDDEIKNILKKTKFSWYQLTGSKQRRLEEALDIVKEVYVEIVDIL